MVEENCEICLHPITNPICSKCYLKQVSAWLTDSDLTEIHKNYIINKIRKNLSIETSNEGKCILCNRENRDICFYCFFFLVERMLKELNFSKESIENFNEIFNYRLYSDRVNSPADYAKFL